MALHREEELVEEVRSPWTISLNGF